MSRENTNFVSGAAPRRRRPTQTAHECTPALGGRRNRSAPPPLPFSRKTRLRHRHRHQRQRRGGALSHTAVRPRAPRRKHARPLRTRNPRRHQRGATRRARGDGHQKRGRGPHGPSHRRTDCRLSAQTRQPDADTHGAEKEHPPPRDCAGANRIGLSPRVCPTRARHGRGRRRRGLGGTLQAPGALGTAVGRRCRRGDG